MSTPVLMYVLIVDYGYDGQDLRGVYSTEDGAQRAVGEMEATDRPDAEVVVVELNAPPVASWDRGSVLDPTATGRGDG